MSESEGLVERESRMGHVSRRDPLTEGAGNLSTTSDPRGSSGRKLKGGFPRTLPSGLWSMLRTRKKKTRKFSDLTRRHTAGTDTGPLGPMRGGYGTVF